MKSKAEELQKSCQQLSKTNKRLKTRIKTLNRVKKIQKKEQRLLRRQIDDLEDEIESREQQARYLENRNLESSWIGEVGPSVSDVSDIENDEEEQTTSSEQEEAVGSDNGDDQNDAPAASRSGSGSASPQPAAAERGGSSAERRDRRIPNFNNDGIASPPQYIINARGRNAMQCSATFSATRRLSDSESTVRGCDTPTRRDSASTSGRARGRETKDMDQQPPHSPPPQPNRCRRHRD